MARHASQDTLVSDYQATFRYRISFGLGRRDWDRIPTAAVEEQEGRVRWQRPNDLQVDVLGRRSKSRSSSVNLNSMFDQPWFVPRSVSDSVRAFGEDFPEHAALHPLAADGPAWYRYADHGQREGDESGRQGSPSRGCEGHAGPAGCHSRRRHTLVR